MRDRGVGEQTSAPICISVHEKLTSTFALTVMAFLRFHLIFSQQMCALNMKLQGQKTHTQKQQAKSKKLFLIRKHACAKQIDNHTLECCTRPIYLSRIF